MIGTKGYYTNPSTHLNRSMTLWDDVGYSLDIPWNSVYTAGWQFEKPDIWGYERKMITRPDPEYYAADGMIRSNVIPEINIHNPIYSFDRSQYTYDI